MKKMLIAIIILLLFVIFLLLYCNCRKKCYRCGDDKKTTDSCSVFCTTLDRGQMKGMIDFRLAKRMAQDYADDNGKKFVWDNERMEKVIDSKSIWFDYEKMKQFLAYVEQSICKNGCDTTLRLGIRFYYAKYPSAADMSAYPDLAEVPIEYANKHTLFMVPTFWNGVKHIDFDPGQVRTGCTIGPIDSLGIGARVWGAAFRSADGGEDLQNHGSMRPPPAGSGVFPEN